MLTSKVLGILLVGWFVIAPVVATVVGRALKAADAPPPLPAVTRHRAAPPAHPPHLFLVR